MNKILTIAAIFAALNLNAATVTNQWNHPPFKIAWSEAANNNEDDFDDDHGHHGGKIPEPKIYGIIGALLSLGLIGYRKYNSNKL